MEKFVVQDSTDNESFSNTGEHMPVSYPRSQEDREGMGEANPAAHTDVESGEVDDSSDHSNDSDQPAY